MTTSPPQPQGLNSQQQQLMRWQMWGLRQAMNHIQRLYGGSSNLYDSLLARQGLIRAPQGQQWSASWPVPWGGGGAGGGGAGGGGAGGGGGWGGRWGRGWQNAAPVEQGGIPTPRQGALSQGPNAILGRGGANPDIPVSAGGELGGGGGGELGIGNFERRQIQQQQSPEESPEEWTRRTGLEAWMQHDPWFGYPHGVAPLRPNSLPPPGWRPENGMYWNSRVPIPMQRGGEVPNPGDGSQGDWGGWGQQGNGWGSDYVDMFGPQFQALNQAYLGLGGAAFPGLVGGTLGNLGLTNLYQQRAAQALSGGLPPDPALIQQIIKGNQDFESTAAAKYGYGGGQALSTPYQQAKYWHDLGNMTALEQARRADIAQSQGLANQAFGAAQFGGLGNILRETGMGGGLQGLVGQAIGQGGALAQVGGGLAGNPFANLTGQQLLGYQGQLNRFNAGAFQNAALAGGLGSLGVGLAPWLFGNPGGQGWLGQGLGAIGQGIGGWLGGAGGGAGAGALGNMVGPFTDALPFGGGGLDWEL